MKNIFAISLLLTLVTVVLITDDSYASNPDSKGKQLESFFDGVHVELKTILFGPITKIVALIGALYGIISAFIGSSLRPLIVFGGIGLMASFGEKFLGILFGG